MSVRDDVESALYSWAASAHEADNITRTIFDGVVNTLHREFPQISRTQLDLLLADERRAAENMLGIMIEGTVCVDDAVNIVVNRFLGGQD